MTNNSASDGGFDLNLFLPYLLNQAAEVSSLGFQKVYKDRYGMLVTDWRVFFHLGVYGRMTARDIGRVANIHKTKVSRAVARLEARRFLIRQEDDADRRVEHLMLTPMGQAAYRDLYGVAEQYDAALVAGLDPDDVVVLRRVLQQLAGRAAKSTV
ncbi:MarR family winged helix-turn-helix transcriptional regulator [Marinovum sp. 2_MG-2023]|uniref:MarR family winged helix-turn-helix transcriptional regulator n=1 Tax=unclassified Marinovum TaxID=2647166 RepID=UPI0026E181ED|nr:MULTISPECIES: MarR family winged helix-turn-helix transcriptional regulator [unclassified Marinovum]MDO6731778.1 MarR family winged helix-turn-helix transcriptional regulator [Marinovum sp. 2_MG-2023]MDO6781030.1 MarR family winged helix-turn-helix transcriptional regulator [Marinovum sp. 1_MG-2023]